MEKVLELKFLQQELISLINYEVAHIAFISCEGLN